MKGTGRKLGGKRPVEAKDLSPSNKAARGVKGGKMGASNYEKKNVTTVKWQGADR